MLDGIPGRVFIDTCLVNFILENSDSIFEGVTPPKQYSKFQMEDIFSLYNLYLCGQRAMWQLAISPTTYAEVMKTPSLSKRTDLDRWFFEMWDYWRNILNTATDIPSVIEMEKNRNRLLQSGIMDPLPDLADRLLIIDAINYNCDLFCTRDYRTILKKRQKLEHLPIKIVSPREWWEMIKPYSAFWV